MKQTERDLKMSSEESGINVTYSHHYPPVHYSYLIIQIITFLNEGTGVKFALKISAHGFIISHNQGVQTFASKRMHIICRKQSFLTKIREI